jgi:hypothetical protein
VIATRLRLLWQYYFNYKIQTEARLEGLLASHATPTVSAQAVIHLHLSAMERVEFHVSSDGICGGRTSLAGENFLQELLLLLLSLIPPYTSFIA